MVETVAWNGVTFHIRLTAAETGGHLGMFETVDHPGYGPPRHIHHDADETFVLLKGRVDFLLAGVVTAQVAGDTVFIPRGTEHSFCVRGNSPARMLTVMTPGGFEGFFREMAAGKFRIPQDMDRIVPIAAAFHQEMTGPPLR